MRSKSINANPRSYDAHFLVSQLLMMQVCRTCFCVFVRSTPSGRCSTWNMFVGFIRFSSIRLRWEILMFAQIRNWLFFEFRFTSDWIFLLLIFAQLAHLQWFMVFDGKQYEKRNDDNDQIRCVCVFYFFSFFFGSFDRNSLCANRNISIICRADSKWNSLMHGIVFDIFFFRNFAREREWKIVQ